MENMSPEGLRAGLRGSAFEQKEIEKYAGMW